MPNDIKTFRAAGIDAFTGGFQVGAARTYKRKPQIWANSQKEIRKVLLTAFPKQATNPKERDRAGRWLRVIHLYYRLGYTYKQVAEEIGVKPRLVARMLYRINRVQKGLRSDSKKARGGTEGRPKTKGVDSIVLSTAPKEPRT